MSPQELNQAYSQTYGISDEKKRRERLEELRQLVEQSNLPDWVRLIDARFAVFNDQFDKAIEQCEPLSEDVLVTPDVRHWARILRGFAYGQKGDTVLSAQLHPIFFEYCWEGKFSGRA